MYPLISLRLRYSFDSYQPPFEKWFNYRSTQTTRFQTLNINETIENSGCMAVELISVVKDEELSMLIEYIIVL